MGDEKEVISMSIKYKDVFNLKELYKLIYLWLQDNGWNDPIYGKSENFETSYLQKDSSSGLKEHNISWEVEQIPHESSYFKYKMTIKITTLTIKSVEVMHEGKKLDANTGEVKIEITAKLVLDQDDKWEKHWFLKNFNDLWKKRIYKSTISEQKDTLQKKAEHLQGAIKKYLNLKGFLMEFEQEPFYRSRSYA